MEIEKKRILIFLAMIFVPGFIISFYLMSKGGLNNPNASVFLSVLMLLPCFAVLFSQFITREGYHNPYLKIHLLSNIKFYLITYFLVQFLIFIGAFVYFLVFSNNFDGELQSIALMISQQGHEVDKSGLNNLMLVYIGFQVLSGPFMNMFFAFGEEYGWHGYLFPKLCTCTSAFKASILSSLVWGLYYSPLVIMGYQYKTNYFGYPVSGICAMLLFCVIVGFTLSYFVQKTKSVFPSVLMRSALTVCFSTATLFCNSQQTTPFIGPEPSGFIGGIGFIITGAICAVLMRKEKSK